MCPVPAARGDDHQSTFSAGMTAAIHPGPGPRLGNKPSSPQLPDGDQGRSPGRCSRRGFAVFFYFAAPPMFSHAATIIAFMPLFRPLKLLAVERREPSGRREPLPPAEPSDHRRGDADGRTGSTRVGGSALHSPFAVSVSTASIIVTVAPGSSSRAARALSLNRRAPGRGRQVRRGGMDLTGEWREMDWREWNILKDGWKWSLDQGMETGGGDMDHKPCLDRKEGMDRLIDLI